MRIVTAIEAVAAIPDGSRVILPHGCVETLELYNALRSSRHRFRQLRLYSGMQFGDYPFLAAGLGENFSYTTWQAAPRLRALFSSGRIEFLPLRFRDVPRVFAREGLIPPDVLFVQVSPPLGGQVSLGINVSIYPHLIAHSRLVIAEINALMPWTNGPSTIPLETIHLFVETERPLGNYESARHTERDGRIADHVLELIPPNAWVQLGVGAVPDTVLTRLHEIAGVNLYSGMLTGGLLDYIDKARHRVRVITGEVCGGPDLYRLVHCHPQIELHPTHVTHDLIAIAKRPRFVSINSAIEVDLHGQINGESVNGTQLTGVGGSLDFIEAAAYSPGGFSIVALPSTTEDGKRSKIVRTLSAQAPVTIPRYCADHVVTEFGVARLKGKTLRERAEALIAIAHPNFRDQLAAEVSS